jgi:hypothetical protein
MLSEIRYIEVTADEPNLKELRSICSDMSDRNLWLSHVVPAQNANGQTVGLWLFFAFSDTAKQLITPYSIERASWWREFRERNRGLGASLTLTGILAVASGIALHFALQNSWIDSTIHLGYFFGVVGLILLLIGLVLVF